MSLNFIPRILENGISEPQEGCRGNRITEVTEFHTYRGRMVTGLHRQQSFRGNRVIE